MDPEKRNGFLSKYTLFFIRIYLRLRFYENILAISRNIHYRIYLAVKKESFHPEMQFKAVFVGGKG